jgi:hypothetical protein
MGLYRQNGGLLITIIAAPPVVILFVVAVMPMGSNEVTHQSYGGRSFRNTLVQRGRSLNIVPRAKHLLISTDSEHDSPPRTRISSKSLA